MGGAKLTGPEHLYAALAGRLAEAIRDGALKAGERLPSVRRLARQRRVSIATAVEAYRALERQRLIEARPRSGFFVATPSIALAEPTVSRPPSVARFVGVHRLVLECEEAGRRADAGSLGIGRPGAELYPAPALARRLAAIARRRPVLVAGDYVRSPGAEPLRRAIVRRSLEFGCRLASDEILVTFGCTEALTLCLRAVARPGDTIALESPTFFALLQMVESLGLKALEIPTHPRDGLSLEALELATERPGAIAAILLMPNFANPLGSLMPDERKAELAALAERRGIPVIEDDACGDVHFGGARPAPVKAWDRSGNVLWCSTFTKTLGPGLRLGWVAPGRFYEQVDLLKRINTFTTPELPQLAVAEFMASGAYDRHLRRLRATVADQVARTTDAVARFFPAGCRITRPAGGFMLWIELPAGVDATKLFRRAQAERIGIAPGALFSTANRFRSFVRLSCTERWSSRHESAIARVGQLVASV